MSGAGQGYGEGFFYTPEDQAAQQSLRRRQAYAQALMQGKQHQGQYGGLADAGNSIAGALIGRSADKQQMDLASALQAKDASSAQALAAKLMQKTPGISPVSTTLDGTLPQLPGQTAPQPQGPQVPFGVGGQAPQAALSPQDQLMTLLSTPRVGPQTAAIQQAMIPQIMNRENKVWENENIGMSRAAREQGQQSLQNQEDLARLNNGLPMTAAQKAALGGEAANRAEKMREFNIEQGIGGPGSTPQGFSNDLKSYSPSDQAQVQQMLDGRMAPPSSFALSKPYWQRYLRMANAVDPTFDQTQWGARAAARKDMQGGGKSYQTLNAGNTAIQHLGRLNSQIGDVAGHQIPLIGNLLNSAQNAGAQQSGLPGVNAYNDTLGHLAEETTKFYRGAGGAEADVTRNMGNLAANLSKEQKEAGTANTVHLIYGKLAPMVEQYNKTMGTNFPTSHFLSKDAVSTIKNMGFDPDSGEASAKPTRKVLRTGKDAQGKKVVQYDDGTIEHAP